MIFRIFISSVQHEFSAERKALAAFIRSDAILSKFFEVFIFEEVPVQDRPAAGVYLDEVDNCDIYLGLHGGEYGNVDKRGVSATQREYERAEKAQKQRICFVRKTEVTDARQKAFLARIDADVVRNGFSDYEELKTAVYAALARFLESRSAISVLPFDASPSAGVVLRDLSAAKIRRFLQEARRIRKWAVSANARPHEVLDALDLIDGEGRILNSAALLFGKRPQHFFRASQVKCAWFYGTEVQKPIADHKIFTGDVFELVDAATQFVLSHLDTRVGERVGGSTAQADVVFEIPEQVVKEAIVNAVCHRDYTSSASVQVMLFKDRLEVWSPGPIPKGMTLAKFYKPHKSYPANPILAFAMYLVRYIEQTGTGAKDMITRCADVHLPRPRWSIEDGNDFKVVIERRQTTQQTTQQITQQTTQQDGSRKDLAALTKAIADAIRRNPSISIGEIMQDFSLSRDGVNYHIRKLKIMSGLRRTSPNQYGVWRWENKV